MYKAVTDFVNEAGDRLSPIIGGRPAIFLFFATFAALSAGASIAIGISGFSPDSWAYFELSKSVFSDQFYRFNTQRSYFSSEYSASFPFGYPVVLAVLHLVAGQHPMIAVAANLVSAVLAGVLVLKICRRLDLPALPAFAIAVSLLLYPPFLDEVFAGRAIPAALLCLLAAYHAHLIRQPVIAGLFLGLSAIVRFDFLVYAVLVVAAMGIFAWPGVKRLVFVLAGLALGVLPWAVYSLTHFGKGWISDNTWVAASALPAFVSDYPAHPIISAADDPAMWFMRLIGNFLPLVKSLVLSAAQFPLAPTIATLYLVNWSRFSRTTRYRTVGMLLLLCLSTGPYLLTGYFDARYFVVILLAGSALLVYAIYQTRPAALLGVGANGVMILTLVLAVGNGVYAIATDSGVGIEQSAGPDVEARQIDALRACHQLTPERTYIFVHDAEHLASRYGAVTGLRTAFIPANFDKMTDIQRNDYFAHMQPYVLIDKITKLRHCAGHQT